MDNYHKIIPVAASYRSTEEFHRIQSLACLLTVIKQKYAKKLDKVFMPPKMSLFMTKTELPFLLVYFYYVLHSSKNLLLLKLIENKMC